MNTSLHFLLYLICALNINGEPLVKISQGTLDGTVQISKNGRRYSAFLGIPYAKPPVGNLRFKNPEPAGGWSGIQSAMSFGNECPQRNPFGLITGNEDCLFLNVYTPKLEFNSIPEANELLPVMFWIHGGGFTTGSSNMFGAEYFLDKNVILVTINYRLGILGFTTTGDLEAPGNYGMKDQVLALKWVQQNIKSFGGDPQKVTIFGVSAGGASAGYHAISQASTGLFSGYISQSGTVLCPWAFKTRENLSSYVRRVASAVRCTSTNSQDLVECLRTKSAASLVMSDSTVGLLDPYTFINWTPTNEPENNDAFLTDSPLNLVNNNRVKDLPFMSGAVSEEGLLITKEFYDNDSRYQWAKSNANLMIGNYNERYFKVADSRKFIADVTSFYFNNSIPTSTKQDFLDSMTRFMSDGFFIYPQARTVEKVTPSIRNSNFFYNFGYLGSLSGSMIWKELRSIGVSHGDDMMYLFPLAFGPVRISHLYFTPTDDYISRVMIDMWTSFATNGRPVSNLLPNPNLWQPYTTQSPVHIQIGNILNNKDPSVTMSNTYYTQRMDFWKCIYPL